MKSPPPAIQSRKGTFNGRKFKLSGHFTDARNLPRMIFWPVTWMYKIAWEWSFPRICQGSWKSLLEPYKWFYLGRMLDWWLGCCFLIKKQQGHSVYSLFYRLRSLHWYWLKLCMLYAGYCFPTLDIRNATFLDSICRFVNADLKKAKPNKESTRALLNCPALLQWKQSWTRQRTSNKGLRNRELSSGSPSKHRTLFCSVTQATHAYMLLAACPVADIPSSPCMAA